VALAAMGFVCVALGLWLANELARRVGLPTFTDLSVRRRVIVVASIAGTTAVALFAAWTIANGQPAVGIALLVAVFVLPELIVLPIRVRRARRRADVARGARRARDYAGDR
jgi:Zn-dependent membrane protease YugP